MVMDVSRLQILNSEPGKDRMAYGPHLLLLPAPVLANITLHGERLYVSRAPPLAISLECKIWHGCPLERASQRV